ncbi:GNAT family N-acetyltransferase [Paenibacillus sp. SYP-B3998]|uniref:GNAT family N-acetyltransferase n=1 Tax=Paenibacillus sp. SYP-B3998 TaxID=2678564 RepID=A0A6G3ZTS7_9BACL|nr:GNAT family N-acetyltransferase [Paenibacillus sp. SYP-B3998]NEW04991.1 GNAT family N-acetyltransferase [Paenibacillus sp. SYP-B3998]
MKIARIEKELAWTLRHAVMWPDRPIDFVKLEDDENGLHYGLFDGQRLLSVISLFILHEHEAQFRKFATLEQEQGKGYGSMLLHFIINEAQSQGVRIIRCNARKSKADFYAKFGLQETNQVFTKEGFPYVVMEKRLNGDSKIH